MKAYQRRVLKERDALEVKLAKLSCFVLTEDLNTIPRAERKRLGKQLKIMKQYVEVLNDRIAAFEEK